VLYVQGTYSLSQMTGTEPGAEDEAMATKEISRSGRNVTVRLDGADARQAHVDCGAQLYVYANEIDEAGPIDMGKAVEICAADPSLVYCDVTVGIADAVEMGWVQVNHIAYVCTLDGWGDREPTQDERESFCALVESRLAQWYPGRTVEAYVDEHALESHVMTDDETIDERALCARIGKDVWNDWCAGTRAAEAS